MISKLLETVLFFQQGKLHILLCCFLMVNLNLWFFVILYLLLLNKSAITSAFMVELGWQTSKQISGLLWFATQLSCPTKWQYDVDSVASFFVTLQLSLRTNWDWFYAINIIYLIKGNFITVLWNINASIRESFQENLPYLIFFPKTVKNISFKFIATSPSKIIYMSLE